ncbi:uncharacterized protein LOC144823590 isoform X4 [Lissotriton helveticus]
MNNWRSRPPAHPEQGHKPQNGRKSGPWAPSKQGNKPQGERRARAKTRHPRPISDVLVQRQIKIAEKTSIEQNGRTSGPWAPSKQGNNPQGERRARAKTRHPRPISDVLVQRQIKIAEKTSIEQNGLKCGPWAPSKQGNKPQGERRARAKTRHPRPISDVRVQKKNKIAEKTSIEQSPAFSAAVQKMDQTIEKKPHDKPPPPDTATQRPDQETEEPSIKQSLPPSAVDGEKDTKDALPTTNVADQKLDPTIEKKSLEEPPPADTAIQRPDQETEETSIKQSLPPSAVDGEKGTKDAPPTPDTAIQRPDQETEETSIKQPPPPDTAIQRPDQETEETSIKQSPPPSAVDGEKDTKDAPPSSDVVNQKPDLTPEEISLKETPSSSTQKRVDVRPKITPSSSTQKWEDVRPKIPLQVVRNRIRKLKSTDTKELPQARHSSSEVHMPHHLGYIPILKTMSLIKEADSACASGAMSSRHGSIVKQFRSDVSIKRSNKADWKEGYPTSLTHVTPLKEQENQNNTWKEMNKSRDSSKDKKQSGDVDKQSSSSTSLFPKLIKPPSPYTAIQRPDQETEETSIKQSLPPSAVDGVKGTKDALPTANVADQKLDQKIEKKSLEESLNKEAYSACASGATSSRHGSIWKQFRSIFSIKHSNKDDWKEGYPTSLTHVKSLIKEADSACASGAMSSRHGSIVKQFRSDVSIKRSEKDDWREGYPTSLTHVQPLKEQENQNDTWKEMNKSRDSSKDKKQSGDVDTRSSSPSSLFPKHFKSLNKEADSACASGAMSSRHGSILKQFRSCVSIKRSDKDEWRKGYPTSLTHLKPLKEQENQNNTWKEMNKSRDSSKDKKQSGDVDTRSSSPSSLFPKHFKSLNKEADSACASGAMSSRHGSILKEFRSCVSLKRSDKDEWRKGYPTSLTHVKPLKEQENQNNTWKEMNKSRDSSKDKKQSGDVDTRSSSPRSLFPKHFKSLNKEADSACASGAMSSRHGSILKEFRSCVSLKRSDKDEWRKGYPTSLTHVKPLKEQENQNITWKEMNKSRDSSKDKKQSGDVDTRSSSPSSLFPKHFKSLNKEADSACASGAMSSRHGSILKEFRSCVSLKRSDKDEWRKNYPTSLTHVKPLKEQENQNNTWKEMNISRDSSKDKKQSGDVDTRSSSPSSLFPKHFKSLNKEADSACASGARSSRHGSILKEFRSCVSLKRSDKDEWRKGYPTSLTHVKPLKEQENQNITWKEMNKSRDSSKDKKQSGDVDTRSSSPSSLFPKHFKSLNKEADSACASGARSSRHGSILKEFRSCVSLKRSDKDEWRKGYPTSLTHVKPLKEQENQNITWKEMNKSRDSSKGKKQSGDVDTHSSSPSSLFPKHFKSLNKEADSACASGAKSSRHGSILKEFRSCVSLKRSDKDEWRKGYPTSLTHVKPLKEQENQNNTWKEMNKSRDSSKDKKQSGDVDTRSSSPSSLFPKHFKPLKEQENQNNTWKEMNKSRDSSKDKKQSGYVDTRSSSPSSLFPKHFKSLNKEADSACASGAMSSRHDLY